MNRKTLIVFGIGVLALAGIVTDASAGCNPPKSFSLGFSPAGDYSIVFPADADTTIGGPAVKGRFWQGGARSAASEAGACPEATYMTSGSVPGSLTIFGQSGGDILGTGPCDNAGCVAGTQITLVQTLSTDGSKSYYAVGKVGENADGFDYSRGGTDWQVAEVPRPRVTQSSRAGSTVTLNLNFDPPNGAYGSSDGFTRSSILSGYQVVRFEGSADPGRNPAAWTNLGALIPVGETGATLGGLGAVCGGTADDVFIAMRPVFDGGQFSGDYVGASTRVECDPAVADPRFKMIERSKTGATRPSPR